MSSASGSGLSRSSSSSVPRTRPLSPTSGLVAAEAASRRALLSFRLIELEGASNRALADRLETLAQILHDDTRREQPALHLDDVVGKQTAPLLFFIIRLCSKIHPFVPEGEPLRQLLCTRVLPLLPRLLQAGRYDSDAVDSETGNNALHELFRLTAPRSVESWAYRFAVVLLGAGVSVNALNAAGRTPLLELAHLVGRTPPSACAVRLLLERGAQLNVQDAEGKGLLHHLLEANAVPMLQDFFDAGGLIGRLDFFLVNDAGFGAATAATERIRSNPNDAEAAELIQAQADVWSAHVRPVLVGLVEQHLYADLASLVVAFVDGSGLPFAAVKNAGSPTSSPGE